MSSDPAPRESFRNDYFVMTLEHGGALVRIVRTATPYPSLDALRHSNEALCTALDDVGREGRSILSDLRLGPGRNDPEFEAIMRPIYPRIQAGFRRSGILVRTAVGGLQIRRLSREARRVPIVSEDEAALLSYLLAP